MPSDVLIKVESVSKRFCLDFKRSLLYGAADAAREFLPTRSKISNSLRKGEFWANRDISFQVKRGEALGLIGHNGAGKTTLLKMLNGLIKPDAGRIEMRGKVGALIALGAGFNPLLTGRENVYANGAILGLSRSEVRRKFDSILEFAEIAASIDSPVQNYSSGMQVRLGFAIAASLLEPDILILDEVLAVGDEAFQTKCINQIKKLVETGCAVILVSHNMHNIARYTDSCLLLKNGCVENSGPTQQIIQEYRVNTPPSEARVESGVKEESGYEMEMSDPVWCDSTGEPIKEANSQAEIFISQELTVTEAPGGKGTLGLQWELVINDFQGCVFQDVSQNFEVRVGEPKVLIVRLNKINLATSKLSLASAIWLSGQEGLLKWKRTDKTLNLLDDSISVGRLRIDANWSV